MASLVTRRYTLAQARSMIGAKVRRKGGGGPRRSRKPSLVDLASLTPGALGEVIDPQNPKGTAQNLAHAYFGYTPSGVWDWKYAWDHQWKPFLGIQIGKRVLGHFAPKLKTWKVFGFRIL